MPAVKSIVVQKPRSDVTSVDTCRCVQYPLKPISKSECNNGQRSCIDRQQRR
ncbi:hypothetical protein DPMN_141358 [Dreissena polymorpha]|uniref:Uncharacterized protein n=1 Tax=Dreissena polymorpha TaxID=45954 RepID=A0A9D4JI80_DREPO|nr:hypothetical protein DPMN_141358 [Dreissena polymorpha]